MSQKEITLESLGFGADPPEKQLAAPTAPNGKTAAGPTTSVEDRALQLLGAGVSAESTASALGVTPSRISQLLSEQSFSDRVATLRYENMQKHNVRDGKYDTLEDRLIDKLEAAIPMMYKAGDISRAIAVVNNAKRRGQSSPDQVVNQQNIVNLVLPQVIAEQFTVNIDNQVTRAGEQELHTMPASNLLQKVETARERIVESASATLEHQAEATN